MCLFLYSGGSVSVRTVLSQECKTTIPIFETGCHNLALCWSIDLYQNSRGILWRLNYTTFNFFVLNGLNLLEYQPFGHVLLLRPIHAYSVHLRRPLSFDSCLKCILAGISIRFFVVFKHQERSECQNIIDDLCFVHFCFELWHLSMLG